MLRIVFTSILILLVSNANAKDLQAYFSHSIFQSLKDGAYIETYMSVVGSTVEFIKNSNNNFQGQIEVNMSFFKGDQVKFENVYTLMSPELADTTNGFVNFLDQQRIPLENGVYTFQLLIQDSNSKAEPFKTSIQIDVGFSADQVEISDFELVESYSKSTSQSIITKSGYDLIPYPDYYYPSNMNKLVFYSEVYNSENVFGKEGRYLLTYFLERFETGAKLNDFNRVSRQVAKPVNVVLGMFNLDELPSGNYNLVIEIRNTSNELLASKKRFIQRSNPELSLGVDDITMLTITNSFVEQISNIDTLVEYIRCLRPISDNQELNFIDNQTKTADKTLMQQFFLNFWKKRDHLDPELAWINYQEKVAYVQRNYGTKVMKGYQTDRGRVYLKYGKPSSVRVYDQMRGKPYEIWHYYKVGAQSNIKFVFVNENPATQIYRLTHSDAVGEPSDPSWRSKVNLIDLDDVNNNGGFGSPNRTSDF